MSELRANYPENGDETAVRKRKRPEVGEGLNHGLPILPLAIFIGALVFFVGIIWYAYQQTSGTSPEIPFVAADSRSMLDDPPPDTGSVSHLDALVLDRTVEARQPEQLLPPAETPRISLGAPTEDVSSSPAAPVVSLGGEETAQRGLSSDLILADIARRVAIESGAEPRPQAAAPEPASEIAPSAPAPAVTPEPAATQPPPLSFRAPTTETTPPESAPQQATPAPTTTPPRPGAALPRPSGASPTPTPTATATGTGTHWIQMGAVDSEAAARAEWARLQSRLPQLLGQERLTVQAVQTGSGTLYRIRTGPMAQNRAAELCNQLKANRVDCWTPPVN